MQRTIRNSTSTRPASRWNRNRKSRFIQATGGPGQGTENIQHAWDSWVPRFTALGLLLLFAGLLLSFFNTSQFYIDEFGAIGLRYLTRKEIERSIGIQAYNVFYVRPHDIESRLRLIPEVRDARVLTSIPNRVSIEIDERRPIFVWQRGGEVYWVDADGIAFAVRSNSPVLPVMRDLDDGPLAAGQKARPVAFLSMSALLSNWSNVPRLVEWSDARGIAFTDDPGWKVYLGDASEMSAKVAKYRAVASQLIAQQARVKFIDISKGDPFYQ